MRAVYDGIVCTHMWLNNARPAATGRRSGKREKVDKRTGQEERDDGRRIGIRGMAGLDVLH